MTQHRERKNYIVKILNHCKKCEHTSKASWTSNGCLLQYFSYFSNWLKRRAINV